MIFKLARGYISADSCVEAIKAACHNMSMQIMIPPWIIVRF